MKPAATFLLLALSLLVAGGGLNDAHAIIQQQAASTKKIKAFMPPKLEYGKICELQMATPVSVKAKDSEMSVKQKLRVAIELLNGGPGVFPDPLRAIRLLRQVMETKTPEAPRAKFQLARLYLLGQFLPENREKATQLVEEVAPTDPYEAGYFLARLYQHEGQYAKAEEYYKRSALAGNPISYLALAYMYRDGLISNVGQERIDQLVALAENRALEELGQGNCKAAHDFGKMFLKDNLSSENHPAGIKWLEAASKAKNMSAISYLGRLYLYGMQVEQSVRKGLAYYVSAAKMNDAESLYQLGKYFLNKQKSTAENRRKGAALLVKAAKQGHQAAIVRLVRYYRGELGDDPQYSRAAVLLRQAITIPDIDAELPYLLGEAYAAGEGVDKDERRAFAYFERAAKLNYRDALVKLGDAYKYGAGVPRTPIKSYRFYRQAASVGSRDGMLALVENYECGVGKPPNPRYEEVWRQRAIHEGAGKVLRPEVRRLMLSKSQKDNMAGYLLLKRRVSNSDREAMVMLAHFYRQGIAVDKDEKMAQIWLERAIARGEEQQKGYVALGEAWLDEQVFGVDPRKAAEYFRKAMEIGSEDAGYELGKLLREGAKGFPPNVDEAARAFRDAIRHGNDNAMRKLAQILLERKQVAEAVALLERSAAVHNIDSILELVNHYLKVAEEDAEAFKKAVYWHTKAQNHYPCTPRVRAKMDRLTAKLNANDKRAIPEDPAEIEREARAGNVRAMRKMAQRYIYGTNNTPINPKQAFKWYLKAAKAGDDVSMLEIGNAFSTGLGVSPSKERARKWWGMAAKAGNKKAASMLAVDPSVVENAPAPKPGH